MTNLMGIRDRIKQATQTLENLKATIERVQMQSMELEDKIVNIEESIAAAEKQTAESAAA